MVVFNEGEGFCGCNLRENDNRKWGLCWRTDMAGRCVGVLVRRSCSGAPGTAAVKPGFWGRMKEKKMVVWTKSLLRDYKEACKDIVVGAKEHPGKAATYLSLLAGVGICSSAAPSEDSFRSSLLEASASLLLLSPWTRSGRSDGHVQRLVDLSNQGRLRYVNLQVLSLVYEAPYDPDCDLYNTQCPHLQPRISDFPSRVLDIGFLGQWWLLKEKMKEFDVNEEEFSHLPLSMKTISYNDLHSQENERLYETKYRPLVCEDHE
ncbi:mitochondrial import inner membrane translocase subunit Tim29 [Hyla sarda]|uniref:mitochondrial import inner membrane translocase subunit Tim29 n=1 Tax=Hyla sarda TaxID=327740 RepID=UPI0024C37B08|nr:mitochondrial import inner membrane translocase subunit Tim29 [Hyla sarda]